MLKGGAARRRGDAAAGTRADELKADAVPAVVVAADRLVVFEDGIGDRGRADVIHSAAERRAGDLELNISYDDSAVKAELKKVQTT